MSNSTLARQFLARLSAKEHPEAIRNVKHYYELRQKRLDKYGLSVTSLVSDDGVYDGGEIRSWEDDHYREVCICKSAKVDTVVKNNTKTLYKESDQKLFYTSVTDIKAAQAAAWDDYCCPNCGAVSKISELLSGCSYCGTRYEMKDLFPKVSLNYAVKNFGRTEGQIKSELKRFMVPVGLIFAALMTIIDLFSGQLGIMTILRAAGTGIAGGVILGYFFWAITKIGSLFGQAAKSVKLLPSLGSDKKFSSFMSKYSPEFSFEHFRGEVVSMLNILIFSEKDTELPFYTGKENDLFEDVIDSQFRGALKLEHYSVKNNICTVKVTAYLENLHYNGSRIRKSDDNVLITLERDLSSPDNFPFGIHAIKCRSCSASFDAYRSKVCPHCGRPYELKDLGWVIKDFRKI